MRNKNLLLGLGLLGVCSAGYAASPYTGVPIHTEGIQDLYLYQVESGMFLHNNENSNPTLDWTTRAHLHQYGLDWGIIAVAGEDADGNAIVKYQIDPKFDHNNSLNIDNHYLDTGNPVSYWSIAPVTMEGVPNAYTITAGSMPREFTTLTPLIIGIAGIFRTSVPCTFPPQEPLSPLTR